MMAASTVRAGDIFSAVNPVCNLIANKRAEIQQGVLVKCIYYRHISKNINGGIPVEG